MSLAFELIIVGICLGGLYALVATGYSLVYGVLKSINFAHGEVYAFGAYSSYVCFLTLGLSFPWTIFAGIVTGAFTAWLLEKYIYRQFENSSSILLLIASIGASIVLRNILSILFGDQFISTHPPSSSTVSIISISLNYAQIYILIGVLIGGLGLYLILKTNFGLQIRALANNREAAIAQGIKVKRIITQTFIISGAYAGFAGVLAGQLFEITPQIGFLVGIKAFTASVWGGIGNISGSIFAAFLLGIIESLVVGYLGTQYRDTVVYSLLVIALIFKPKGLIPQK